MLDPDFTGSYPYAGIYDGHSYWSRAGDSYLHYDSGMASFVIQEYLTPADPGNVPCWAGGDPEVSLPLEYDPVFPATGTATVAEEV
ncbi:MAG TPA: hypothetical protein VMZ92_21000 [Planctomycetota bacterium]|nr:hypothetical protein [Planctomycetota bacterium]